MIRRRDARRGLMLACFPVLAALLTFASAAIASTQPVFASAEAAVDALASALASRDPSALATLLGEPYAQSALARDAATAAGDRERLATALAERRALRVDGTDRRMLEVGVQQWTFSIPIVREAGGWRFATELGLARAERLRRLSNEGTAIYALRAYVDAQRAYAGANASGGRPGAYAMRIVSRTGQRDGLYWPSSAGEPAAPLGHLAAEEANYLSGSNADGVHRGYRYRILTRQGPHAPGGERDFVVDGRLERGFGMIAYPVKWGATGRMTFIVSHDGQVHEADLGATSDRDAPGIDTYDPDPRWRPVRE
jgi:hypothetical protein